MRTTKLIICIIALLFLLSGCHDKIPDNSVVSQPVESKELDVLYGIWELDNHTKYEFDGLGTGELILSNDSYYFTYEVKEDVLSIDFSSSAAKDSVYKFSINNNLLLLDSQDNNKGNYTLKREDNN